MSKPAFVYVTYIASSADKVWEALTEPRVTAKYWYHENLSDWKAGSKWEHRRAGGDKALRLVGKIVESVPPRRLVVTWAFPADEKNEGRHTRVTFEVEEVKGRRPPDGDARPAGGEPGDGRPDLDRLAEGPLGPEVAPRDGEAAPRALVAVPGIAFGAGYSCRRRGMRARRRKMKTSSWAERTRRRVGV